MLRAIPKRHRSGKPHGCQDRGQSCPGTYPSLEDNRNRDKNVDHCDRFGDCAEAAEHKSVKLRFHLMATNISRCFVALSTMEIVVVHPAYWNHGYGGSLVKWGMDLAAVDEVNQGAIAAKIGEDLYRHLGYKTLKTLGFPGDEVPPRGVGPVAAMLLDLNERGAG